PAADLRPGRALNISRYRDPVLLDLPRRPGRGRPPRPIRAGRTGRGPQAEVTHSPAAIRPRRALRPSTRNGRRPAAPRGDLPRLDLPGHSRGLRHDPDRSRTLLRAEPRTLTDGDRPAAGRAHLGVVYSPGRPAVPPGRESAERVRDDGTAGRVLGGAGR